MVVRKSKICRQAKLPTAVLYARQAGATTDITRLLRPDRRTRETAVMSCVALRWAPPRRRRLVYIPLCDELLLRLKAASFLRLGRFDRRRIFCGRPATQIFCRPRMTVKYLKRLG